jgi:hypothetical protein
LAVKRKKCAEKCRILLDLKNKKQLVSKQKDKMYEMEDDLENLQEQIQKLTEGRIDD